MSAGCPNARQSARPAITQQELVKRSQELADAVASGNKTPWQKYFADDCTYFDEKGRQMDKAALVKDVEPLPKGYSGTIEVVNPQSRIVGDTAILSFDEEETETIFGQELHARYHETDTWMRRNGEWQIIAGQVLRYYEDPASGKTDAKKYKEYEGTFELAPGHSLEIAIDGNNLYRQRGSGPKELMIPEASDIFFRKGVEGRLLFRRGDNGKVDALIDRRNNEDILWSRPHSGSAQSR